MNGINGRDATRWIEEFSDGFFQAREEYAALDRAMGDGDFAENLCTGLDLSSVALRSLVSPDAREVFTTVGIAFLDGVGGTSGPLFGLLFLSLGEACGERDNLDRDCLAHGLNAAVASIARVGGAVVGDKTMIDALEPAAQAVAATKMGASIHEAVRAAAEAGLAGAASTKDLLARRGRGSYVGEHARGVMDPGARAVAEFLSVGIRVTNP